MNDKNDDKTRTHVVLTKGTMVSHYRIDERIGAGGMGEVYLAEDTNLKRPVALKFLPAQMVQDEDTRLRFAREAQAAAKLDHPNIVTIYEVDEFQGQPFLVMQYVEGHTLHHYCHEVTLSFEQITSIGSEIAAGLSSAHGAGVVHRDIKASNIILDSQLRPKILDFGLAIIQGGDMLTKTGSTLGTVAYMSPEQVQGHEADHRSDIFSLGVVLYELVTGRTPFRRNSDAATLQAIINDSAEPMARYKVDVAPDLQRLVDKALAKNPLERYQSAADLSAHLSSISRSLSSVTAGPTQSMAADRPSVAVLPFANMSADAENEYFSDGLTEELLNVLAKNPELKVTGRTSSFAFKGKQEDLRVIGQKLGVGMLLEGSVRKASNRVRITAQLISVADGFHIWSETYDRVLEDIFAVQDEIAAAVARELHVTLVGATSPKKVVDQESYSLTLRARQSWQQMNKESLAMAMELYRKAVKLDPENAQAWAGLSLTYAIRVAYGHGDHHQEHIPAREAAEKALALDSELPAAHNAMSWVYAALELRMREGLPHIHRAYELAPNDAGIVSALGTWEMLLGNFDRAIELSQKSLELDPLNPFAYRERGRILFFAGRLDEALEVYEKTLEMSPNMTSVPLGISGIRVFKGEFEEALKAVEKERLDGYRLCGQAVALWALGRRAESDQCLEKLIGLGVQWGFQVATVYAYREEMDPAFEWLEHSYEHHDAGVPLIKVHPFIKPLRTDPRWGQLIEKVGLND